MPSQSSPYYKSSEYQTILRSLQQGEWELGLQELEKLCSAYPAAPELRKLLEQTKIRARMDEYEVEENRAIFRKRMLRLGMRLAAVAVVIGITFFLAVSYYAWAMQSWTSVQQRLEGEVMEMEASVTFRQAQNLLAAGRYQEASDSFQSLQKEYPDLPDLEYFLNESQKMLGIDQSYDQAVNLIQLGNLEEALTQLEAIERDRPAYRDVRLLMADLSHELFLMDLLEKAENNFQASNWEQALLDYENIVFIDPDFEYALIEGRLFTAYIAAANEALAEESDSLENLERAENFYQKALALRPQDSDAEAEQAQTRALFRRSLAQKYVEEAANALGQQADSLKAQAAAEEFFRKASALQPNDPFIRQQRDMSRLFLIAQDEFVKKNWDVVIEALELVFQANDSYALGTARLTLFEAYMARGKMLMVVTDFPEALADFQRAAEVGDTAPFALPLLYASRLKIAETQAAMGSYELATRTYMALLEDFYDAELDPFRISTNTSKLQQAIGNFESGSYKAAYRYFKDSLPGFLPYSNEIIHTVEAGEYLVQLANRYNTTVEAIIALNQLQGVDHNITGKPLIMPTTKP